MVQIDDEYFDFSYAARSWTSFLSDTVYLVKDCYFLISNKILLVESDPMKSEFFVWSDLILRLYL